MEYYMTVYVALVLAAVANYFLRRLALILATLRASQARFLLWNGIFHAIHVQHACDTARHLKYVGASC
jgi:hypothetical protein